MSDGENREGQQEISLYGPKNGNWTSTQSFDWVDLCPDLSDGDCRLYGIMRSLLCKNTTVRTLTMDELRKLTPSSHGGYASLSKIRRSVDNLSRIGLLSTRDGGPIVTSSRDNASMRPMSIQINDLPRPGYQGWRNTYDALEASRAEARGGSNMSPAGSDLNPKRGVGSDLNPSGSNMTPDPAGDVQEYVPPSYSSSSSSRRDEDEDLQSPLRGYDAQIQEEPEEEEDGPPVEVTSVDLLRAKVLLEAIPWPGKRVPMGAAVRQKILIRMAELSAGGWTERDVAEYISGRIPDWKAVRRPADLVATLLADSPTRLREAFQEAPEPREEGELAEARRDHERLARLLEQQQAMIADCSVCDEMGWFIPVGGGTMEWHGHGKMGLNVERNRAGRKLAQLEEAQAGQDEQVWEFAKG